MFVRLLTSVSINAVNSGDIIWPAAAVGLAVVGGFFALRQRPDFTIRVKGGKVTFTGKLPAGMHATLKQFFASDLNLPGSYRVVGRWTRRVLQLRFAGDIPRFHHQRVRNFLMVSLR